MSYKLLIVISCDSNDDSHAVVNSHIVEFEEWSEAEKAYDQIMETERSVTHLTYDVTKLY